MVKIFVEGKGDSFLIDCLYKNHPDLNWLPEMEIIDTRGWTKLPMLKPKFDEVKDNNGRSLVIFDADYPNNNGGFDIRTRELLEIKINHEIDFELFLFPNNEDDGDLEVLLENIAHPDHSGVLECFDGFGDCISKLNDNGGNYSHPDKKAKIYTYISSLIKSKTEQDRIKKSDFIFEQAAYWDLDSDNLKPLIEFLKIN